MRRLPAITPLQTAALAVWAALVNVVGLRTWRHGRETFWVLLAMAGLMLLLPSLRRIRRPAWLHRPRRSLGAVVAAATLLLAVRLVWICGHDIVTRPDMTDIPRNTWQAGTVLLRGDNPYATRCQLWADLERGEHVRQTREGVELFGVPYRYGFPYFPGMVLSYLPARLFGLGMNGIRPWNLLVTAATLWGLVLLVRRLAPAAAGAPWLAAAAMLAPWVYPQEIFGFAVVDIVIAGLAVFAMLALAHDRPGPAGVLLGAAQACKLLPAPVLALAVLVWLWNRPGRWRFLIGYAATAAALIVPFVLRGPAEFLSATVLFYLVHHAGGDTTALYPYLPRALRLPHQVLGFVLTLAAATIPARRLSGGVTAPLVAGAAAYVVFIAFGRMAHLNYLWSVWPPGCAALAVALCRPDDGRPAR